ncbi:glycosyltransferase [Paraburkholderia solitsugae]|uniref:glycosyltransferase n=1 Tax=Paraburkholderia solitsugae TaxID=2675748 RepID=UPI001555B950|nr:glycosyltransferase [Paraburkholderia solitsugae]
MKILHVIPSADPVSGGPIEFVTRLAAQLVTEGHCIHLVSLDEPVANGEIGQFASVTRLGRGVFGYRLNLRLIRWLRAHAGEFDAIVVDGLWQFHGAAALVALGFRGIRYHVFSHGMLDPWFKRTYPLKHMKKLIYWLVIERQLLKRAASVIFTCETERLMARGSFPFYRVKEAISVLGTAPASGAVLEGRSRADISSERKRILYLSRIHEVKGVELLIEAFASLKEALANYDLVIAGPGKASLVASLKALASTLGVADRVAWCGMVRGGEKWALLRSAEVFCLPSHQESFGMAVIEALACGVPVLITNKVNIWREITASSAGFADEDTVDGIRRMIVQWVTLSETDREQMQRAARLCFDTKFHIEKASASYLAVLNRQEP